MGLIDLTKEGQSFLLDENDIFKVYTLSGNTKVEVLKSESNTIDTVIVEESLNAINTLAEELIEVNYNGVPFLVNYTNIREIIANGTGSKIVYEGLIKDIYKVDETPSEIQALIPNYNPEPEIKSYKALISQNAPIASTLNVSMVAGQIWTLDIYSGLDMADPFNQLELISGTIRVAGSKYRSNADVSYIFTTTQMSYDGSPYIVSTDANGDFNPFINTTGVEPSFPYNGSGDNIATFTGLFANKSKVYHNAQNTTVGGQVNTSIITDDDMGIATLDNTGTPADDILNYTPFEIEINP